MALLITSSRQGRAHGWARSRALAALSAVVFCTMFAAWLPRATADDAEATEYELKAAFVYNFAKFTEWPEIAFVDEASPVRLCIVGEHKLADSPAVFAGKLVHGRSLELRQVRDDKEISRCHIVYFSRNAATPVREALASLRNRSVLAIGENEDFLREGGTINFVVVDSKVRFQVNVSSMQRAGLRISSKLLRLAEIYTEEKR